MTNFFDWEEEGFYNPKPNLISCDSTEFINFKDRLYKDFKYHEARLDPDVDIWFPEEDVHDPNLIFDWTDENSEDRWTFIFSIEHLHMFFSSEQDMLKFIFKWGQK